MATHTREWACVQDHVRTPREFATTYALLVSDPAQIRLDALLERFKDLFLFPSKRLPIVGKLTTNNKKRGTGKKGVCLFPDEKEALEKALEWFA